MKAILEVVDVDKEYGAIHYPPEERNLEEANYSGVGTRLTVKLGRYLEDHELGEVYGPDATFKLGNNHPLPAVSFISSARFPADGEPSEKGEIAPDLAVEVISQNDVYTQVVGKVADYFAAGVKQVWLITPKYKTVTVYQSPAQAITLFENEDLTSEALLPGFRCPIKDLFKQPKRA